MSPEEVIDRLPQLTREEVEERLVTTVAQLQRLTEAAERVVVGTFGPRGGHSPIAPTHPSLSSLDDLRIVLDDLRSRT